VPLEKHWHPAQRETRGGVGDGKELKPRKSEQEKKLRVGFFANKKVNCGGNWLFTGGGSVNRGKRALSLAKVGKRHPVRNTAAQIQGKQVETMIVGWERYRVELRTVKVARSLVTRSWGALQGQRERNVMILLN